MPGKDNGEKGRAGAVEIGAINAALGSFAREIHAEVSKGIKEAVNAYQATVRPSENESGADSPPVPGAVKAPGRPLVELEAEGSLESLERELKAHPEDPLSWSLPQVLSRLHALESALAYERSRTAEVSRILSDEDDSRCVDNALSYLSVTAPS